MFLNDQRPINPLVNGDPKQDQFHINECPTRGAVSVQQGWSTTDPENDHYTFSAHHFGTIFGYPNIVLIQQQDSHTTIQANLPSCISREEHTST